MPGADRLWGRLQYLLDRTCLSGVYFSSHLPAETARIVGLRRGETPWRGAMKSMRTWLATVAAVVMAGSLWAQEPAQTTDDEAAVREPARQIKVLENPYDIASFYRSHQGQGSGFFGGEQPGWYGASPYAIAGFYRQHPAAGYSRFWTNGYGFGRTRPNVMAGY